MNKQPIPDLDKLGLDPEVVQALKPRLILAFGEELGVSYTSLQSTGNALRCSLEEGEEVALRAALDELKLDPGQEPPVMAARDQGLNRRNPDSRKKTVTVENAPTTDESSIQEGV